MGLDASVFRNVTSLENEFGIGKFEIDSITGEAVPKNLELERNPNFVKAVYAEEVRIGNVATVDVLREHVGQILGCDSLVVQGILYSGSHSGDLIPVADFYQLKKEVDQLRATKPKGLLLEFVNALQRLLDAGEREGNPIVFE